MGKRPYFIIITQIDCDGFNTKVDYITNSYPDIKNRYTQIFNHIKERYFLDEGIDEEEIYDDYRPLPQKEKDFFAMGGEFSSYINDDRECWITLKCVVRYNGIVPAGYNFD